MTLTDALVDIPVRLDFDAIVPRFSRAVASLDHAATAELDRVGIDRQLREMVRLRASQINGCVYCVDLHSKDARTAGVTEQKLHAIAVWRDSGLFTAAERAVLHLTESITRLSETHVPEEDLAAVTARFGEERTAALVSLIIVINVWDAIGVTTRCWPVARDQA
ncbi:carboxymuconolactone decarboxylase family protein [Agromyces fucosus]|uniref:Carboxymuconolactone decarboxylase family protein n=1 Tax=Agromyces fucosus TaxID=41985 RepID=A0A4Q2JU71_9MICO|nr:carboxymuconolactone decarboxylase family protein [Agromyces fucosus]RXZ50319.1 carboxymuconolactone decarboxylase family protein [Agromyces fucosus]